MAKEATSFLAMVLKTKTKIKFTQACQVAADIRKKQWLSSESV